MNLNELKIKIAEVLGVSDTEKDLAFEIFIQKTFFVLDDEETLKVPEIGFFQFKTKPFQIGETIISEDDAGINNTFVYAPAREDFTGDEQSYLTIDIPHQKKDLFELDESVFSIGVGKPILPISDEKNGGDAETSYVLLKKSIEERVGEKISESEHLKNFDIWEDHISMLGSDTESIANSSSHTIHKLTDDIEYTEEEIKPIEIEQEETPQQPEEESNLDEDGDLDEELIYNSPVTESQDAEEDEFAELANYDESLGIDEDDQNPEDVSGLEMPVVEKEDLDAETKFEGIEDFKSTDEKKLPTAEDNVEEEKENVDWDWGDDLLGIKNEDEIDVENFDKEDEPESEQDEEVDEEENTNLFIQLEKSLSGEEDEEAGNAEENEDEIDEQTEAEVDNILYQTQLQTEEKEEDTFKPNYIRNFLLLFGAFALVVMLVLVFVIPSGEEPVRSEIPVQQDDQSTDIVTREPVADETGDASINDQVPPQDPDENPIEERTRQMQQSSNETNVAATPTQNQNTTPIRQGELYRNIPNERSVRGLIFTDGSNYFVQVSSWPTKVKAETEARRLRGLGFDAFIMEAYIQKYRSTWYRVKIGDFSSTSEAENFLRNNKF